MKKQNANNRLAFNKVAVTELNDQQLLEVDGGTSTIYCVIAITVAVWYLASE